MAERICRTRCLHFTGAGVTRVSILLQRPAVVSALSNPLPSPSQIVCNDVIQWANHVTTRLPVSVGLCCPAALRLACLLPLVPPS